MDEQKVRNDVQLLRKRLRENYDMSADLVLINQMLESRLMQKVMEEIDAVFGTYSTPELVKAIDINAEIQNCELASEAKPH